MDMNWTPEQTALRHMLRELLTESDETGVWKALAEAGVLGLSVAPARGGAGAGMLEEQILFEEAGRAILSAPLFSNAALSAPLLSAADSAAEDLAALIEGRRTFCLAWAGIGRPYWLNRVAIDDSLQVNGTSVGRTLSGLRRLVPDLPSADAAVVVGAGPSLHLVDLDAPEITIRPNAALDTTRQLADLVLDRAPSRLLSSGPTAAAALDATFRRAITLAAAEIIGISECVLGLAARHASERHQFGRPIGSFQAVAHRLADIYGDIEMTRSLTMLAAASIDNGNLLPADLAAMALSAQRLALSASEAAIQVHGGMGMTWESPLHHYYKRARYLRALIGPAAVHRKTVSDHLLQPSRAS